MTREQKLALIVGFALVLIVGVLVSDHLSLAQRHVAGDDAGFADALTPETESPGLGRDVSSLAIASPPRDSAREQGTPLDETYFTGEPPTRVADSGGSSLQERAMEAFDMIADGANHVGSFLRDGQNSNFPAAKTEFVTPSLRDDPAPSSHAPAINTPARETDRGAERAPSRASTQTSMPGPQKANYPVHTVAKGESLWSIAEHYYADGTLYTKLAAFNTGRTAPDGTVRVGATLLIPPRDVLTGKAAPASSSPKEAGKGAGGKAPAPATKAGATKAYTVQSGDTLSEISQKLLGTSKRWEEILDLNKDVLEDAESLRVGMTLKIPAR